MTPTELSAQDREALAWLRGLPPGARIAWGTHHLSLKHPYSSGWVDVCVPELMDAVGWSWVWTVEQAGDPEAGTDVFSFPVPYDAAVEVRAIPGGEWGIADRVRLVYPDGCVLALDWLVGEELTRWLPARRAVRPDGDWLVLPVWTPAAVSQGIEGWIRRHAGRTDLRLRWDPELPGSPIVEAIAELLRHERSEAAGDTESAGEALPPEALVELLVADDPDVRELRLGGAGR